MQPPEDPRTAEKVQAGTAHSARVGNYLLGGRDDYGPDRDVGDMILSPSPRAARIAPFRRRFPVRVVRHLTAGTGIRQFPDVGAGLPTVDDTHEVAQRVAPGSRIVYVENDPLVLVRAQAPTTAPATLRSADRIAGSSTDWNRRSPASSPRPRGVPRPRRRAWAPGTGTGRPERTEHAPEPVDAVCGVGRNP